MKRLFLNSLVVLVMMVATAWGAPAEPPILFYTLSVSTTGASVETQINGEPETFLSGGLQGSLASSVPINLYLKEGENSVEFIISPGSSGSYKSIEPTFNAFLEILFMGEVVDTSLAGERMIFERTLTDEEITALKQGNAVTITETFMLTADDLNAALPR